MTLLSLVMIVKNEEHWLKRPLRSVAGVVDEMIVVDTGSTDRTVSIARKLRAQIHRFQWTNDFSAAKNFALDKATGDWALVLDADEELDPLARRELRPLVAATSADAIQLKVRSLMPPGEISRYDDLHITRLFRNRPTFRYEGKVHEQILPAIQRNGGAVQFSDLTILHYGYQQPTAQGGQSRVARNLTVLEGAIKESPNDPYLLYQLGATQMAMGEFDPAQVSLSRAAKLNRGELTGDVVERLYLKLGQLALGREEYQTARRYAEMSLEINPLSPIAGYVAGVAAVFLGDLASAYRRLKEAKENPLANLEGDAEVDAILAFCRSKMKPS